MPRQTKSDEVDLYREFVTLMDNAGRLRGRMDRAGVPIPNALRGLGGATEERIGEGLRVRRMKPPVGEACGLLMDDEMRGLPCRHLQLDEQWTFVGKKQRRLTAEDDSGRMGDFWIWAGICSDTRLVPTFRLGKRTQRDANAFVSDLAGRMENRVEVSADGLGLYVEAIEQAFGGDVDLSR